MAREIVLFATYRELLYPDFRRSLNQSCLDVLVRREDPGEREAFALAVLRHISPEFLVRNIPLIFKSVAFSPSLALSLFREIFGLTFSESSNLADMLDAIKLCEYSLDNDDPFVSMPVETIITLHHMLRFVGKRIRMTQVRASLDDASPQIVFGKLWSAFIQQPGHVHPELVQAFTHVISIHSLESFRDAYSSFYQALKS